METLLSMGVPNTEPQETLKEKQRGRAVVAFGSFRAGMTIVILQCQWAVVKRGGSGPLCQASPGPDLPVTVLMICELSAPSLD